MVRSLESEIRGGPVRYPCSAANCVLMCVSLQARYVQPSSSGLYSKEQGCRSSIPLHCHKPSGLSFPDHGWCTTRTGSTGCGHLSDWKSCCKSSTRISSIPSTFMPWTARGPVSCAFWCCWSSAASSWS